MIGARKYAYTLGTGRRIGVPVQMAWDTDDTANVELAWDDESGVQTLIEWNSTNASEH